MRQDAPLGKTLIAVCCAATLMTCGAVSLRPRLACALDDGDEQTLVLVASDSDEDGPAVEGPSEEERLGGESQPDKSAGLSSGLGQEVDENAASASQDEGGPATDDSEDGVSAEDEASGDETTGDEAVAGEGIEDDEIDLEAFDLEVMSTLSEDEDAAAASAMGTAYYNKLREYMTKWGYPRVLKMNDFVSYAGGVSLAMLVDFDADGTKELLVSYYFGNGDLNSSDLKQCVEVWTYRNGSAQRVYNINMSDLMGSDSRGIRLCIGRRRSDGKTIALLQVMDGRGNSLIEINGSSSRRITHAENTYSSLNSYFSTWREDYYQVQGHTSRRIGGNDGHGHTVNNYSNDDSVALANKTFNSLSPASPFRDVTNRTPHFDDILWLSSVGITTGYSDGTFHGDWPVVRQDMAAFLFRLAKKRGLVSDSWQPSAAQKRAFRDVTSSTPHAREIWWLASVGISTGYKDGTFRGGQPVVRQDMAAFLFRLAKLMGRGGASDSWQPSAQQKRAFSDVKASTPHAREVWWLAAKGVSTGYSNGTFRGGQQVVRQDMAAFLHRLYLL